MNFSKKKETNESKEYKDTPLLNIEITLEGGGVPKTKQLIFRIYDQN